MKKFIIAVAAMAALPFTAHAQETAPDGTRAFGIEPYVGIGGGYHSFDGGDHGKLNLNGGASGALITGFAGVNVPLGPLVVGAEGNVAKGFSDIDWEYGVTGRIGFRAGESGLIYARAGYQWVNGRRGYGDDRNELYGIGVEVGPKDIGLGGITGNSGVRLRLGVDTFDNFQSLRPTGAVVFHF